MTKSSDARTIKLDIASRIELLEVVQTLVANITSHLQFEEDAAHYMSVAIRESLVNAIKHGNKLDESKRVLIAFTLHDDGLEVEVHDEGPGFDPGRVPDPLAPENLLKAGGRGIFFMRQFMDEVRYAFPPRGGTVVTMLKRRQAAPAT